MSKPVLLLLAAGVLFAQQRPNGLYAIFETSKGTFTARLYEKDTPNTVAAFVGLARGTLATRDPKTGVSAPRPYFNNNLFHRVVPGEMIQGGDPTGTRTYHCGFTIPDEVLPGLRFDGAGKLAMANTGQPNSGSCQFFVTVNAMRSWDGAYTIFGTVVDGLRVVDAINRAPVRGDQPVDPVQIISVTIERVGPEPVVKKRKR